MCSYQLLTEYKHRPILPMKKDGLHQGDNIPAGIVSSTDDGHMDGLKGKEQRMNSHIDRSRPFCICRPAGKKYHLNFLLGSYKTRTLSAAVENNLRQLLKSF